MIGRSLASRFALLLSTGALVACGSAPSDEDVGTEGAAVTDVPVSGIRDQNTAKGDETNNCWLYTTTAWVESLELAQLHTSNALVYAVPHISVAYYDYWDWYSQITTGKTNSGTAMDPTALDGGGEWGDVGDMMLARGVVQAADFATTSTTISGEANVVYAAAQAMAKSLKSGALKSASARSNGTIVRQELDRAFALSSTVKGWLTDNFGADGAQTLQSGTTPSGPVKSTDDIKVFAPHADGSSETVTLTDAFGTNAGASSDDGSPNSNKRNGDHAWQDAEFTKGNDAANRAYFIRVQKALNAGVALPFGWFWADNADPGGVGLFKGKPVGTTNSDDSTGHYTLAVDYQASKVPGFGTLKVGVVASADAKAAALAETVSLDFIRVKDSEPYVHNVAGAGYSDLYMSYLLSSDKVYDKTTKKTTTQASMMANVILPPGF